MYRIELKPGEENVFRTIEELATAIRNGLVTPRARIFHNASQKWLPIEFHPHYKKALSMPATKSGETPAVAVKSRKSGETQTVAVKHAHAEPPAAPVMAAPAPAPAPASPPAPPAPAVPVAAAPPPVRTNKLTFIPIEKPEPVPPPLKAHAPAPAPPPAPVWAPAPERPRERPVAAVVSPVVDLPTITYDQPVAHVETPHPVAHAPIGRTAVRGIRPLHLAVAAAVLIIGSYVALSAATPSGTAEVVTPVVAKPLPIAEEVAPSQVAAVNGDTMPARRAPVTTVSTTGPTFGGPAAPPAPAKPAIVTTSGASAALASAKDSAAAIEPAPVQVDLSLPSLPSGDSLAPAAVSDTGAMRRILRAVGGKAPASRP